MYPATILIVKTSSLGDIIQSFAVLSYLKKRYPKVKIDWAVEQELASIVKAHPLVSEAISLDIKGLKRGFSPWKKIFSSLKNLRKKRYDLIFDLQGNTKSGVITGLSRGKKKIGLGRHSVREWPNVLATHIRFEIPRKINIRLQQLCLVQQFFEDTSNPSVEGVRFKIDRGEEEKLQAILGALTTPLKVMVCPGSRWENKQIPLPALLQLLEKIEQNLGASFFLMWGCDAERALCEEIAKRFPKVSFIVEKLSIPLWQNLMSEVDLVLAVDSSALHLAGTTSTPSFSVFGPTNAQVFKPIGAHHFALQGICPYGKTFEKTCPILRSCATGACTRNLSGEEMYDAFIRWWKRIEKSNAKTPSREDAKKE